MFRTSEFFIDKLEVFDFVKNVQKSLTEYSDKVHIYFKPGICWSIYSEQTKPSNEQTHSFFHNAVEINTKMSHYELEAMSEKLVDGVLAKHYRVQAYDKLPLNIARELFPRNKFRNSLYSDRLK